MMDLARLKILAERLRVESVGDPEWIQSKGVFEYPEQPIEVAVVLKIIRATQGVHALDLLCRAGLFVDMGAIYRCVGDCSAEVYFLLEDYPCQSSNGRKFLRHFFAQTIDVPPDSEQEPVPAKKIHNAMIRALTGNEQDERIKRSLTNVYKTFSGYTHAGYSHIMQMYGGRGDLRSFNIDGISSQAQRDLHMRLVQEAYTSVICDVGHVARTFQLHDLHRDILQRL
jgi:hypothetical protein